MMFAGTFLYWAMARIRESFTPAADNLVPFPFERPFERHATALCLLQQPQRNSRLVRKAWRKGIDVDS
jgi:hypothetical protein